MAQIRARLREVDDLRKAGDGYLTLWVLEGNTRARRFYERAGWRPDGTSSRWERFNVHTLRYRLDFEPEPAEHYMGEGLSRQQRKRWETHERPHRERRPLAATGARRGGVGSLAR